MCCPALLGCGGDHRSVVVDRVVGVSWFVTLSIVVLISERNESNYAVLWFSQVPYDVLIGCNNPKSCKEVDPQEHIL